MAVAEGFVTILVPEDIRRILKHASAESALPMYRILCDLVYQAYPQYTDRFDTVEENQPHAN